MLTDTILEDDRWQQAGLDALAETAALATLRHLGLPPDRFGIAVLGCDDMRIATLNADFRGKPQPTNVLSWPEEDLTPPHPGAPPPAPHTREALTQESDEPRHLGDIAIAYDTCATEAQAQDKPFSAHVTHLIVHGVLHLLGYDHIRDADATLMERLETEILGILGIPDPYG